MAPPKFVYYRDDESPYAVQQVREIRRIAGDRFEPESIAGVCFGWMHDGDDPSSGVMFRVYWPVGSAAWDFNVHFALAHRLLDCPKLLTALRTADRRLTLEGFCAMLDCLGFKRIKQADAPPGLFEAHTNG